MTKLDTQKIEQEMERQGMSALDLAIKTRKHTQWIYDVLKGKAGKSFVSADEIAAGLGVPTRDILSD